MNNFLVAIAGGTGVGKSTLAHGLMDEYPEEVEVVNLDDYMKPKEQVSLLHGMHNFDDPKTIDWEKLIGDLKALLSGNSVEVMTKNLRFNPDFYKRGKLRIPRTIQPKRVILVEGFLVLYNEALKKMFDYSVYLDASLKATMQRRTKIMENSDNYNKLVVEPMHEMHVAPTKVRADLIIDVSEKTAEEVKQIVKSHLAAKKILSNALVV